MEKINEIIEKPKNMVRDNILESRVGASLERSLSNALILGYEYLSWGGGKLLIVNTNNELKESGFRMKDVFPNLPDSYINSITWENTINSGRSKEEITKVLVAALEQGYEYVYHRGKVYHITKDSAYETSFTFKDIK